MVVTPEFHIIVLKNDDSTFSPVYGRVYEEDCEYDETTEGKEGEMEIEKMEVEEDDEGNPSPPNQPINSEQRIGGKNDSGGITNAIPKTGSPILNINGDLKTFSYYEIEGDDIKKVIKVTSLSASNGSEPAFDPNSPMNRISKNTYLSYHFHFISFYRFFTPNGINITTARNITIIRSSKII